MLQEYEKIYSQHKEYEGKVKRIRKDMEDALQDIFQERYINVGYGLYGLQVTLKYRNTCDGLTVKQIDDINTALNPRFIRIRPLTDNTLIIDIYFVDEETIDKTIFRYW